MTTDQVAALTTTQIEARYRVLTAAQGKALQMSTPQVGALLTAGGGVATLSTVQTAVLTTTQRDGLTTVQIRALPF